MDKFVQIFRQAARESEYRCHTLVEEFNSKQ